MSSSPAVSTSSTLSSTLSSSFSSLTTTLSQSFPHTTLERFGLTTPTTRYLAAVGVGASITAFGVWLFTHSRRSKILPSRPLHWVFKVGDLESTVKFYSNVFGLTVQRHEEFEEGCAATCNGPYSGWWSKTMMSVTSEEDFSIELTYNYGVSSYAQGNDLVGLHVAIPGSARRARESGLELHPTSNPQVVKIQNPDGQWFFLHEESLPEGHDPFLYVSLNTENLTRAVDYYVNVLGMRVFSWTREAAVVGYSISGTKIELIQFSEPINHGDSFGRIAFGNKEVFETHQRVVRSGDTVINAPISLETPNKANVVVAILKDRDGNEICMVDDEDFRRLSQRKPGDEIINWASRSKRIAAQNKFTKSFARQQ